MGFTTHAAERAAERYGLTPTRAEWSRAVLDIIDTIAGDSRAASLVAIKPGGKEEWLVNLAGSAVLAIYAPSTAVIVTLRPVRSQFNRDDWGRKTTSPHRIYGRRRTERAVEEDWGE